jgi:hypothetical protein
MGSSNKENSDDTNESSTGGEASADYIIRGAGEGDRTTSSSTTIEGGGGITDKIKDKIKGAKDKVASTADTAADTTKKGISSTTTNEQDREYEEGGAGTRTDRKKDSTQEYDEKEPMSPAKIKQHEPTAVSRDPSDQKIAEGGQTGSSSQDAAEKARRSGMTKGTAGAAETGSEYEQGAAGSNK